MNVSLIYWLQSKKKKKFHWKSWEILVQGNPQVQHAEIHINTEIFISYSPKFVSQLLCNPDLVLWFSPCGFRYLSPGVVEFRTRHSGTRVYTFEQCSSPTAQWVKSAGNAGDTGDMGAIPGLGPLEEGMETLSSILSWRIPRTEEPGGLHIVHRVKKSQTWLKQLSTHIPSPPSKDPQFIGWDILVNKSL